MKSYDNRQKTIISEVLTLKQLKKLLNNGGASLKGGKPKSLKSGYMVSLRGFEMCLKSTNYKKIIKAIEEKQKQIDIIRKNTQKNIYYVGLWLNDNICYIDISMRIATKKEAIIMGLCNSQLAIFNNRKNESIYLMA